MDSGNYYLKSDSEFKPLKAELSGFFSKIIRALNLGKLADHHELRLFSESENFLDDFYRNPRGQNFSSLRLNFISRGFKIG